MPCNCQRKQWYNQQILRREHTITLLKEMNQKQIQSHQRRMKEVNETINEYTREKHLQCERYTTEIQRLRKKVDHYKLKCCKLNEKIKENSDLVKVLMDKKLSLQAEIIRCREDLGRQRDKQVETTRYKSEMKQIISLQQIQNEELIKQCAHMKQEIQYLRKQIEEMSEIRDKFINVENISDEQYKNQLTLLKGKLEYQFCKSTNDILNQITGNELNETANYIKKRDQNRQMNQNPYLTKDNYDHEELQKISNYIDYGFHYFSLNNNELKLPQSIRIFKFISSVIQQRLDVQKQLEQQRQTTSSISTELKEQILSLEEQYKDMNRKIFASRQTQTMDNSKIADVININSQLKLKIYELHNMVVLLSNFATFTIKFLEVHHQKQGYYHFTEKMLYRKVVRRPINILRKIAMSVLFIEILSKKTRRVKRINLQPNVSRENIKNYVSSQYLQRYFYNFFLSLKRNNNIKNHKIDQILKQKFQFCSEIKLIEIINQELLNQGKTQNKFGDLFNRFQFEMEHRLESSL